MITTEEYIQLKAFARIDGIYLALVWIVSFACYVGGFTSPVLSMVASLTALASPLFAAYRLRRFRDDVREGVISYRRAVAYFVLMFVYASLLFALAQYVYFAFIDQGYLIGQYTTMMSASEVQTLLQTYGMTKAQVSDMLRQMQDITPVYFVFQVLMMNIVLGFVLGIPMGLLTKRRQRQERY